MFSRNDQFADYLRFTTRVCGQLEVTYALFGMTKPLAVKVKHPVSEIRYRWPAGTEAVALLGWLEV